MIDPSVIAAAIGTQLRANLPAAAANGRPYTVEVEEEEKLHPNACPWVGVYGASEDYSPRGTGAPYWKVAIQPMIFITASHAKGGLFAAQVLGEYVKAVLDALELDRTLGGTVAMVLGYNVEHDLRTLRMEKNYLRSAVITINAESRQ